MKLLSFISAVWRFLLDGLVREEPILQDIDREIALIELEKLNYWATETVLNPDGPATVGTCVLEMILQLAKEVTTSYTSLQQSPTEEIISFLAEVNRRLDESLVLASQLAC